MSFKTHYLNGLKYIERIPAAAINLFDGDDWHIDDKVFADTYPAVYGYAMDMLEKEGEQSAEALYHNLNTLESRQGSQVSRVA